MPPGPERGGPQRRAAVFLRVVAGGLGVALAAAAPAAVAATPHGKRIPPSGTIKATLVRPLAQPFQPLPGPVAWPRRSTNPGVERARKARLAANWPPGPPATSTPKPTPRRSSTRTVQSGGLNQTGLTDHSGSPPDTTGSIGPAQYVEFINSQVGVFDRNTLGLLSQQGLGPFAQDTNDICDPQIQWDPQSNRWYYLALFNCSGSASGQRLDFGWSLSANPTDLSTANWCHFRINTGTTTEDYPKLGHDDSHLIIGTNAFDSNSNSIGAHLFVAPEPAPGATTCTQPTVTTFTGNALQGSDGSAVNTPVPANISDSSPGGYVVAADDATTGAKSHLVVWQVGGSATSPTLTALGSIAVAPYDLPANVPQPGTADVLDSLDARLTQAVAHADPSAGGAEAIWTQHTVSTAGRLGRAVVRWYEILPASLSLRQSGTIDIPNAFAFNAAISPTSSGSSAVVDYNVGSSSQLVDIRVQSRNAQMASGAMAGELVIGSSSGPDVDFTCSSGPAAPCRWGDYAGASPDPADGNTVWGSNQFNGPVNAGNPAWGTRNFAIRASVPPTASFSIDRPTPLTGDVVTFASTATHPDGPVAPQAWDFGSGNFTDASGATVTHAFARPGTYTVRLRVTDPEGTSSDAAQNIAVGNRPPVPRITITPNPLRAGRTARFSASSSTDPDGTIVRYAWDLDGNGSFERSTTSRSVRRRYTTPRSVRVRLRVTDDSGATAVTALTLRVRDPNTVIATARNGLTASLRAAPAHLSTLLGPGVAIRVTANRAGRAQLTIRLTRTTARALGVSTAIARRAIRFRRAGRRTVHLRPGRVTRARLAAGRRSLRATIGATVTDRRGGRVRLDRRILLRR